MGYDYLFVGAGLFSATAANMAAARGARCLVIDKRGHVGGNCHTEARAGINVHVYGAHIFHTNNRKVWDFVNKFADFNGFVNSPIANFKGTMYNLPFNMNTFCRMWPDVTTPEQARAKIAGQTKRVDTDGINTGGVNANTENGGGAEAAPRNLEEQAISLVGRDIYETLIKGYTEKQWGRRCADLPASIIKRIPVRYTYDNRYYDDRYQGVPTGGYTAMIERMLDGIPVRLGCDYFDNRDELDKMVDKIIFTGMIDEYFGYRYGRLAYRTLRFEHEELPGVSDYQGNAVVNYTDAETPYTRIIEHKHFEFGWQSGTIITREYPKECEAGDEPYYPVNDCANSAKFKMYDDLAKSQKKVIFGGRLGTYKYMDMDDVIESALGLSDEYNA